MNLLSRCPAWRCERHRAISNEKDENRGHMVSVIDQERAIKTSVAKRWLEKISVLVITMSTRQVRTGSIGVRLSLTC
jgi:hypothetical protein